MAESGTRPWKSVNQKLHLISGRFLLLSRQFPFAILPRFPLTANSFGMLTKWRFTLCAPKTHSIMTKTLATNDFAISFTFCKPTRINITQAIFSVVFVCLLQNEKSTQLKEVNWFLIKLSTFFLSHKFWWLFHVVNFWYAFQYSRFLSKLMERTNISFSLENYLTDLYCCWTANDLTHQNERNWISRAKMPANSGLY